MLKSILAISIFFSALAMADVPDTTPLTSLPVNTVFTFKKDVTTRPNVYATLLKLNGDTAVRLLTDGAATTMKTGQRTVFYDARTHVLVSELQPTDNPQALKCGVILYLNTEAGAFFNVQVHSVSNCEAVPTVGELRTVFDLEFHDADGQ